MSSTPLDRPTISAYLERGNANHAELSKLLEAKQLEINRLQAQLAEANTAAERLRGALEYNNVLLNGLRGDMERLESAAKAATEAARQSQTPTTT